MRKLFYYIKTRLRFIYGRDIPAFAGMPIWAPPGADAAGSRPPATSAGIAIIQARAIGEMEGKADAGIYL